MIIFTLIAYFLDIRHYGREFVEKNCNLFERVGRWFLIIGWAEIVLLFYAVTH